MIKVFIYLPLHIFNTWLVWLAPRWIFKISYTPSNEAVRENEMAARNKIRLVEYKLKSKGGI